MGCTNEPKVVGKSEKEQIRSLKIQLKLKTSEIEGKIKDKKKEIEKCRNSAKTHLKMGDKNEAKRQIKKKIFNEKIIEKLHSQIRIIDDQLMTIENIEVNKDIAGTIKTVNAKLKEISAGIDINEIERAIEDTEDIKNKNNEINEEFGEALKQGVDEDPDIEDELDKLEAEMNKFPQANKENLVSPNIKGHEKIDERPKGNLEFY